MDSQVTRAQSVLAVDPVPNDITAKLEAALVASLTKHLAELAEGLNKRFEALSLENRSLRQELVDTKVELKDTKLELQDMKRKNDVQTRKLHDILGKTNNDVGSMRRSIRDVKNVIDRDLIKKNNEKVEKMFAWFAALSMNEDPLADIRAFIAKMEGQEGSLFRDGLVIPEGPDDVDFGDDDDGLTITM